MQAILQEDEIIITGKLVQNSVMRVLRQCEALLPFKQELKINLAGVEGCDSASLALLTALMRLAEKRGTTLSFIHLPKQMMSLCKVSGIETILPIKNN